MAVYSRVALAPRYLYYFDSVNFALALDDFNPALHQPQPPGYPLFVLFSRALHALIPRPEHTLLAAGLVTLLLAAALIWLLGELMFSARAGFAAALLLIVNPVSWLSGLSNPVRLWLAAGSAAVAVFAWIAIRDGSRRAFVAACLSLGVLSGFRPMLLFFLAPLLVYACACVRPRAKTLLAGGAALTIPVAAWLTLTVQASGGLSPYVALVTNYARVEFSPYSLILGAPPQSAWFMAKAAMLWSLLGVPSWIWTIAFARPSLSASDPRVRLIALWILPGFLFHLTVHVGDPDHTLAAVAALCVAGGSCLDRFAARMTSPGWAVSVALACAINVIIFFLPAGGLIGASNYRAVEYNEQMHRETFQSIRDLRQSGPLVAVWSGSPVTWRHLSFYFPDMPVYVLDARGHARLVEHSLSTPLAKGSEIAIPCGARVVWLTPDDPSTRQRLRRESGAHEEFGLLVSEPACGGAIGFGSFRLTAASP